MVTYIIIVALTIFSYLLSYYLVVKLFPRIDILKLFTFATSLFFIGYILSSALLFGFDQFSILRALLLETGILVACSLIIWRQCKNNKSHIYYQYRSVLLYVFIALGVIISWNKYELFGMGQDEGVYQIKAMLLATGNNSRQLYFPEMSIFKDENIQEEIWSKFSSGLSGFYRWEERVLQSMNDEIDFTSGVFHGIPTYPAVLALFAKLFGFANMQHVHSIFYLCTILYMIFIVEELCLRPSTQHLVIGLAMSVPIIHWVTKASVTESFLCLIYSGFLYCLLIKNKILNLSSLLFVIVFCVWHVSIYVMLPLILLLYFFEYCHTRQHHYLAIISITSIVFSIGLTIMCFTSPGYTLNNIMLRLTFFDKIGGEKVILPLFWSTSIVITAICIALMHCPVFNIFNYISSFCKKHYIILIRCSLLILVCTLVWNIGWEFGSSGISWTSINHLSIFEIIFATGCLVFPLSLIKIFQKPSITFNNKNNFLIFSAYLYTCLLIPVFTSKTVWYNYYYLRYFAPYIIICLVACGVFLDCMTTRTKHFILTFSLIALFPFNFALATQQDITRLPWTVFSQMINYSFPNNTTVIVDGTSAEWVYYFPLKVISRVDVFPKFNDFPSQLDILLTHYNNIYIIDKPKAENVSTNYDSNHYQIIQRIEFEGSERHNTGIYGQIIPFPLEFQQEKYVTTLYRYIPNTQVINFSLSTERYTPIYYDRVHKKHDVMINKHVEVHLGKTDQLLTIKCLSPIDIKSLKSNFYIDVNLNSVPMDRLTAKDFVNNNQINVFLPKDSIYDGKNTISIRANRDMPLSTKDVFISPLLTNSCALSFNTYNDKVYTIPLGKMTSPSHRKTFSNSANRPEVAWGPYITLNKGNYLFHVNLDTLDIPDDIGSETVVAVAQISSHDEIYARMEITPAMLKTHDITLPLSLYETTDDIEVVISVTDPAKIKLQLTDIYYTTTTTDWDKGNHTISLNEFSGAHQELSGQEAIVSQYDNLTVLDGGHLNLTPGIYNFEIVSFIETDTESEFTADHIGKIEIHSGDKILAHAEFSAVDLTDNKLGITLNLDQSALDVRITLSLFKPLEKQLIITGVNYEAI